MPSKPPYDPNTMSPAQEPEPSPFCAAPSCRSEALRFYERGLCRQCYRKWVQYDEPEAAVSALEELDKEKEEHLEQYATTLERALPVPTVLGYTYQRIARELRLINAGVSPDDIRNGTYPNLSEFKRDDYDES